MNTDTEIQSLEDRRSTLHSLTESELALLGVEEFAYVRRVVEDDGEVKFAIHRAAGSQVAVVTDRDTAFAAVRQNGLEPLSVH